MSYKLRHLAPAVRIVEGRVQEERRKRVAGRME
jgi:hypothetical protein